MIQPIYYIKHNSWLEAEPSWDFQAVYSKYMAIRALGHEAELVVRFT
jgi:hypothetical protein